MPRPVLLAIAAALALSTASEDAHADDDAAKPLAPYELDSMSRTAPTTGRVPCPKLDLVNYAGTSLRYSSELAIHPAFAAHLAAFEKVVREAAVEVYGREPLRIHHLGTYSCRRIGGYPNLLSEHSLGNAIDVDAFDFGPLPKAARASSPLPAGLKNAFRVSVLRHFRATGEADAIHRRF